MLSMLAEAGSYLNYSELGLDPVALDLGFFQLRWYSLAYLAGILIGYWYLTKLVDAPGAPMARRHADDMIFYATLGIILGGRIGYILFYQPSLMNNPLDMFKVWEGGMSLHGGALGTIVSIFIFSRVHKLQFLRICDYIACCIPFGLFFGRLANFVNGELWGRATDVPWAMIFPTGDGVPRHPSQLYEAGLEGLLLFAILWLLFWKSQARYKPGLLMGTTAIVYGASRFFVEFFRQPDAQLLDFAQRTGLSMGQWLTIPMILIGLYLVLTAKGRRQRIEPIAGQDSVA
jgi:phosphatidylglycerol:prolipoprotein diacylglycerol transferase